MQRRAHLATLAHVVVAFAVVGAGWWLIGFVISGMDESALAPPWVVGVLLAGPFALGALVIVFVAGRRQAVWHGRSVAAASAVLSAPAGRLSLDDARCDALAALGRVLGWWTLLRVATVALQALERTDEDTSPSIAIPVHGAGIIVGATQGYAVALTTAASLDSTRSARDAADGGATMRHGMRVLARCPGLTARLLTLGAVSRALEALAAILALVAAAVALVMLLRAYGELVPIDAATPLALVALLVPTGVAWAFARARTTTTELICSVAAYHADRDGVCPAPFVDTPLAQLAGEGHGDEVGTRAAA